jgi:hypothetical protein
MADAELILAGQPRNGNDLIGDATLDDKLPLQIAEGASLFELDGRPVLFSESHQKLYGLNETAAYIWRRLQARHPPSAIARELTEVQLAPAVAAEFVRDAVQAWLRAGLLKISGFNRDMFNIQCAFNARLGTLCITVRCSSRETGLQLRALLPDRIKPASNDENAFHIGEALGLCCLFHNGINVLCSTREQLVPAFKAYLIERILMKKLPDVLFHAACMMRGKKLVLIGGAPGAGKSTLSAHLMDRGFRYGADDIVTLSPTGFISGITFAPTIKLEGSGIINDIRPDLKKAMIHVRPDGKRVRYLKPMNLVRPGNHEVGWIVFIDRDSGRPTGLRRLGQFEAMRRLVEGSYAADGLLTSSACGAARTILTKAHSYELSYSNASDGADLVEALCNAPP